MSLSPNQRILLNFLASYGRTLYGVLCGLISGRWALMALGEVDYGLLGLIGGLVGFVSFFNGVLSTAVSRFYAISIGAVQAGEKDALETCRKWFNTALLIHTIVPLVLIAVGYPLGMYAVRHWLVIPPDRISACGWLWRFTCISCFLGMVSVPWNSFYYAKQMIAELTLYSVVTTTLNVIFLHYIVNHPGDWLVAEGLWLCLIAVVPGLLISARALLTFPECQFRASYLWSPRRLKQLFSFSGWQLFGATGALLRGQGMAVLMNRFFGPAANAASTVANHISSKTCLISSSFMGALGPAIANACGAKDYVRMRKLAFSCSKYGTALTLLLALPLAIELPLLVQYWLKTPPQYAVGLCWCVLGVTVIDQTSTGHMMAVNAKGKIALYQAVLGSFLILTLPIAWLLILAGAGVYAIGYGALIGTALCAWGRVFFARHLVGMSLRHWVTALLLPLSLLILLSLGAGSLSRFLLPPSPLRILLSASLTEATFLLASWKYLFAPEEREYLLQKARPLWHRWKGNRK